MIKEIRLRYEAHAGTVVKLASKLTVLLGVNDHGKSAINRGIKWVVTNLPRGDSMVPWSGKKTAQVEIITDTDSVIRQKGPGNKYIVNGDELAAVGAAVPEEVTDTLKMGELNIQNQVDQYFLLQATPGEVAKRINAVAGIEESDKAIKRASQLINEADSQAKALSKSIKEGKEYLDEFSGKISAADRVFNEMEDIEKDLRSTGEALAAAKVLADAVSRSRARLDEFPDYSEIGRVVDDLEEIREESDRMSEHFRNADALRIQLNAVDLEKFANIEKDEQAIAVISDLYEKLKQARERYTAFNAMLDQLKAINTRKYDGLAEAAQRLKRLEEDLFGVEEQEAALANAQALASELRHRLDSGIQLVEPEVLKALEAQQELVYRLTRKKELLCEISEKASVISAIGEEVTRVEEELKKLSEYCSECGRKLDATDHIHG